MDLGRITARELAGKCGRRAGAGRSRDELVVGRRAAPDERRGASAARHQGEWWRGGGGAVTFSVSGERGHGGESARGGEGVHPVQRLGRKR